MKRGILLLISVLLFGLVGCSREVEPAAIETQYFEIAMEGYDYLQLELPRELSIAEQDAFYYWKFDDETTIYKTNASTTQGDKIGNCYYIDNSVSRNFDDCTITISADKDKLDTLGALLDRAEIINRPVLQYQELGTIALPEYMQQEMVITSNNLYMPVDYDEVTTAIYTAAHKNNGTSFIISWIARDKLDTFKPLLHNLVVCNSGQDGLDYWYENSECYFVVAGDKVAAAHKLTYNQWVCYLASNDTYANYVVQAMHNISSQE